MLIWRIGANAIPTKENFLQKINVDNPNCKICNQEVDTCCHLFFKCPVAKATWHSTCWGLHVDKIQIASCEDIINLVLNPPQASCPTEYSWMISLNMVIVLDEIWQLRNRILYQDEQVDILRTIRQVNYRYNELSRFFSTENPTPPLPIQYKWEPPPQFWIKLDMDAAIVENWSTLVVIARDDKDVIVNIWSKVHQPCSPLIAEATAILWAAQIAKQNSWSHILIEGDTKECFDHLSSNESNPDWSIYNIVP